MRKADSLAKKIEKGVQPALKEITQGILMLK
jgi:hypothetical protein